MNFSVVDGLARKLKATGGGQTLRYIHKYANSPRETSLICILRTDKTAHAIEVIQRASQLFSSSPFREPTF